LTDLDPRREEASVGVQRARRWFADIASTAFLLLAAVAPPSPAADAPERFDASASCMAGECHEEVGEHQHLHWPDLGGVGECRKCHVSDGDLHDFSVDEAPDLCLECHEAISERMESADTVHDPAEDCLDCHAPHGGEVEAMLLEVSGEDLMPLCFECHDKPDIISEKYIHGPVEHGACNQCHDPHASPNASLLLASAAELCKGCHEEQAEEVETAENVHDPAEDDCTNCHHPHSGPAPKMLPAAGRELCDECHDDIVEIAETSTVDHAPTTTGDECLSCHSPHASDNASMLLKPQRELCTDCHDEPLQSGDSMLIDMKQWLSANEVWHEPIRRGECAGCHQPHGSENLRLLKEPFPESFYANFDVETYGLCFSCHQERLATTPQSRTVTGFRDGDRNLHYLHVNKARRGRTCRVCHEMHASRQPMQIRERIPYGKWLMPLNYEKHETGGSCLPGCHKKQVYDRDAGDLRGQD
jgi:predicted CXXCH cytochrome family protein